MGFSAHGKFCIQTHARIMRIDARGPWNLECTSEYARELERCLHSMSAPFAILAVSHEQAILSPDAEHVLRLNVRERVARGCVAQATVLGDVREIVIARARYRRIYQDEGLRFEIFTTDVPAMQWLAKCGFPEVTKLHDGLARAEEPRQRRGRQ